MAQLISFCQLLRRGVYHFIEGVFLSRHFAKTCEDVLTTGRIVLENASAVYVFIPIDVFAIWQREIITFQECTILEL